MRYYIYPRGARGASGEPTEPLSLAQDDSNDMELGGKVEMAKIMVISTCVVSQKRLRMPRPAHAFYLSLPHKDHLGSYLTRVRRRERHREFCKHKRHRHVRQRLHGQKSTGLQHLVHPAASKFPTRNRALVAIPGLCTRHVTAAHGSVGWRS